MADYSRRQKSVNEHLRNLTSAKYVHLDGSTTTGNVVIPTTTGANLLRVVVNTKGAAVTIRSGTRVIGIISSTAAEQTYDYGVYCESGIQIDMSTTGDLTVVYDT